MTGPGASFVSFEAVEKGVEGVTQVKSTAPQLL